MKNIIKTVLVSLAALTMLSTAPIKLNAYNMNEPKLVVQSEKADIHVNFSRDGKKFAYSRMKNAGPFETTAEIMINENGIEKVLTQGYADFKPSFSPDGKKVAFFRKLALIEGYIYTMDIDGKNLEKIAPAVISNITWSPDGKEIAFTCEGIEEKTLILTEEDIEIIKQQPGGNYKNYKLGDKVKYNYFYSAIGIADVKTKNFKYLTTSEGQSEDPEFTDDGKILYIFRKDKNRMSGKELWVMDKDGSNKKPLIQLENYVERIINKDGSVTIHLKEGTIDKVSSDGDLIAYISETRELITQIIPKKNNKLDYDIKEIKDESINSIHVKNLKTGEIKLVTDEGDTWFPKIKNNKIYFSRCKDLITDHDIYSMDLK